MGKLIRAGSAFAATIARIYFARSRENTSESYGMWVLLSRTYPYTFPELTTELADLQTGQHRLGPRLNYRFPIGLKRN